MRPLPAPTCTTCSPTPDHRRGGIYTLVAQSSAAAAAAQQETYGSLSITTSGQRRRTSTEVRAKPTVFRRGLGRSRSANRSARPKGASMWSRSSASNRTPTANVAEVKRSNASAVAQCTHLEDVLTGRAGEKLRRGPGPLAKRTFDRGTVHELRSTVPIVQQRQSTGPVLL